MKKILPPKLNIETVAAELGLLGHEKTTQYYHILQFQRDYGLIIKLGGNIEFPAQKVADGVEEVVDEQGNHTLLTQGETHWINCIKDEVLLGSFRFLGESQLSVSSVHIDGTHYYVIDETQMFLDSLCCDLQDAYVEKEDFMDFLGGDFNQIPEWKNPRSDYYAPEMVLAEEAHRAIRIGRYLERIGNMESRTYAWLKERDPSKDERRLSNQAKRISTIIGKAKKTP